MTPLASSPVRATALIATLAVLFCSSLANATTFSFGTIAPTDIIHSVVIAPVGGTDPTVEYNAGTGQFTISGYISTINFLNRSPISLTPGDVTFSSQLSAQSFFAPPPLFPGAPVTFASGTYSSVGDDFWIVDWVGFGGSGPISVIGGDYDDPLIYATQVTTASVLSGIVTAELGQNLLGDADFLNAFGNTGSWGGSATHGTGNTLCGSVINCPAFGPTTLNSFAESGTFTLLTNNIIPEPSTALLLGLGLLGTAARRKRFSRN